MRHRNHTIVALAVSGLLAAACTSASDSAPSTADTSPPTSPTTEPTTTGSPTSTITTVDSSTTTTVAPAGGTSLRSLAPFAPYTWVPLPAADVVYPGPATPTSLDDVLLVEYQQRLLQQPALVQQLEANGFVVQSPGSGGYFHEVYKAESYGYQPLFVTTDALYHSWHLVFDKVLRDIEQDHLLPILEHFLTGAVVAARAQEQQLAGSPLADAAQRATAYYEAAAVLAGLELGTTSDRAAQEVELAQQAARVLRSPVSGVSECVFPEKFDGCVDYSVFLPRGHYTRTPELKRYFAAMSLLGQEFFGLSAAADAVLPGVLVTRVLAADATLLRDWTAIYEPTAFLVGLADDVTPIEVATVTTGLVPDWLTDPTALGDLDTQALAAALVASHPTAIDPERAGIRLMGARFTLDAYVLDQLAWPNVGTETERRVDVSALDVAASLGSHMARTMQLASEEHFADYRSRGSRRCRPSSRRGVRRTRTSCGPRHGLRSRCRPHWRRTPS